MLISTKGRYSLRICLDLAEHYTTNYTPMKDVAARQEISLKYLERILPPLAKAGIVEAVHGKGGGYRLMHTPGEITVWDILVAAEGEVAPVTCLESDAKPCERMAGCKTLPLWSKYYELTKSYFSGVSLQDLVAEPNGGSYEI